MANAASSVPPPAITASTGSPANVSVRTSSTKRRGRFDTVRCPTNASRTVAAPLGGSARAVAPNVAAVGDDTEPTASSTPKARASTATSSETAATMPARRRERPVKPQRVHHADDCSRYRSCSTQAAIAAHRTARRTSVIRRRARRRPQAADPAGDGAAAGRRARRRRGPGARRSARRDGDPRQGCCPRSERSSMCGAPPRRRRAACATPGHTSARRGRDRSGAHAGRAEPRAPSLARQDPPGRRRRVRRPCFTLCRRGESGRWMATNDNRGERRPTCLSTRPIPSG